jgi:hypothetical protein
MDQDNEQPGMVRIPLNGTFGAGPESEITIITKNPDGQLREITYVIPYFCLNMSFVQRMNDLNFIVGYKIVKGDGPTASGLKELGL